MSDAVVELDQAFEREPRDGLSFSVFGPQPCPLWAIGLGLNALQFRLKTDQSAASSRQRLYKVSM